MSEASTQSPITRIRIWHAYADARTEVWSTRVQFNWFLRRNRTRLVKAGALLMIGGAWHVDPDLFDAEVMAIARDDAQSWIDRESGKVAA